MPFVAPWLVPPDFLGAMKAGGALGEGLRGQDIQAQEAGNRLRLAYDQLAASSNEHAQSLAAQQESSQAAMALHAQQQTALEAWRHSQETMHQQALTDSEKKVAAAEALRAKTSSDAIGFLGAKDTNVDHAAGVAGPNRPDSVLLPQFPEAINNPVVRHDLEHTADMGGQNLSGPVQGVPLLGVDGNPIKGKTVIHSKNGYHIVDDHSNDADLVSGRLGTEARKFNSSILRPQIIDAQKRLDRLPKNSPNRAAHEAELNALKAKAHDLYMVPGTAGAPTSGAGKKLIWNPATGNFGDATPGPSPSTDLQDDPDLQLQPQ